MERSIRNSYHVPILNCHSEVKTLTCNRGKNICLTMASNGAKMITERWRENWSEQNLLG